ncbi:hypothetical protein [Mycobacterium tuberculosis]|uniref:hypothetical protein n=1 Tax=Mycobacterium tuberculosis TaxID=1773 RepID=UPI003CC7E8BE
MVDHSAAAPYRLLDIRETDADVVTVNAHAWGGPPIGAMVFRDPSVMNSFGSVSTNPYATGPARLEIGVHQFGHRPQIGDPAQRSGCGVDGDQPG